MDWYRQTVNGWKKFKSVIQQMGYKPSQADLAYSTKKVKKGKPKSFIIIYLDDRGIFSDEETIQEVLTELGKIFRVKPLGKLENFIGCSSLRMRQKIQYGFIRHNCSSI
jgi:hypothetical protein